LPEADILRRFPKLDQWERGAAQPTLKQLEAFAKATHTPIGYFFLPAPPVESTPLPDFRTAGSLRVSSPSPDLLDTIYACQERQEWYREYARSSGEAPFAFVGSASLQDDVAATATRMRDTLGFQLAEQVQAPTWTDALRRLFDRADEMGVLVMCSGVVLNNNKRKLNPSEFRGFALADEYAPLVFINGADTKAGQMFTLAHELAHIWLGQSSLDDAQPSHHSGGGVERWCNQVAAELLVPLAELRTAYQPAENLQAEMDRLARRFKVSTLVVLRRIFDAGELTYDQFQEAYERERERLLAIPVGGGGNFYLTQAAGLSLLVLLLQQSAYLHHASGPLYLAGSASCRGDS
jgi:Zn-dependent peptidase ImmA (M78 family)